MRRRRLPYRVRPLRSGNRRGREARPGFRGRPRRASGASVRRRRSRSTGRASVFRRWRRAEPSIAFRSVSRGLFKRGTGANSRCTLSCVPVLEERRFGDGLGRRQGNAVSYSRRRFDHCSRPTNAGTRSRYGLSVRESRKVVDFSCLRRLVRCERTASRSRPSSRDSPKREDRAVPASDPIGASRSTIIIQNIEYSKNNFPIVQ